jgi:multicomponent K+:H+ antiporter subunit D
VNHWLLTLSLFNHWLITPILLPLLCGTLLMLITKLGLKVQRILSLLSTLGLLFLSVVLLYAAAGGEYQVYALGDWPAPFGIVLVLDRLSALLLLLTALVALGSLLYAILRTTDAQGSHFHPLFQLQLLGLNGAFLTGDLFNLFVFFEILLIASYSLLLHGGGPARTRAALHYVIINLVGSSLFLIGIGVLYGVTGTLNMADLALKIAAADPQHGALLRVGGLLLLLVFALKAALLPLYFWLPAAYSSTSAPVAALFAIMTKVGVYAIVRMFTLAFGPAAGGAADVAAPWLLPLALATLVVGTLGVLASTELRRLLAYFVVVSVGTLLTAVGLFNSQGLSAALVYLSHTTLMTAALFILADLMHVQRGSLRLDKACSVAQPVLMGVLFFFAAIALTGLPPLSGFLAKLMILQAALNTTWVGWVWGIILLTSLLSIVALSRAGSSLFWMANDGSMEGDKTSAVVLLPVVGLLICSPLLMLLGEPISTFSAAAAQQLSQPSGYIKSVLPDASLEDFQTTP